MCVHVFKWLLSWLEHIDRVDHIIDLQLHHLSLPLSHIRLCSNILWEIKTCLILIFLTHNWHCIWEVADKIFVVSLCLPHLHKTDTTHAICSHFCHFAKCLLITNTPFIKCLPAKCKEYSTMSPWVLATQVVRNILPSAHGSWQPKLYGVFYHQSMGPGNPSCKEYSTISPWALAIQVVRSILPSVHVSWQPKL